MSRSDSSLLCFAAQTCGTPPWISRTNVDAVNRVSGRATPEGDGGEVWASITVGLEPSGAEHIALMHLAALSVPKVSFLYALVPPAPAVLNAY
jgi:hypothetical protein